jgi:hypothetical protein
MRVRFKSFRRKRETWDALFERAAQFAGSLDPRPLLAIAHSADNRDGVGTVWSWEGAKRS